MKISIFSLKEILFQDDGLMVNAKGIEGELTILPNHVPMITELLSGDIKIIDKNNKPIIIPISSGFLEVNPKEVKILCQKSQDL